MSDHPFNLFQKSVDSMPFQELPTHLKRTYFTLGASERLTNVQQSGTTLSIKARECVLMRPSAMPQTSRSCRGGFESRRSRQDTDLVQAGRFSFSLGIANRAQAWYNMHMGPCHQRKGW